MSKLTVGFIGAGNMGGALATAAAAAMGGTQVYIADADAEKAAAVAQKLGANPADNAAVVQTCDYVFLGVKPYLLGEVITSLLPALQQRKEPPVLVSMAAGVTVETVQQYAGHMPVIRIMPNTPVAVGSGLILYTLSAEVTPAQEQGFLKLMSKSGRLSAIAESQIDAASAVSGCGPAFVYLFIEALADGGVECGLTRQQAQDYAAQMVLGAARMVQETGCHPGALKDAVCSPGGTTIAGVHALESGAFRALCMDAVTAAYDRTLTLAQKNK